MYLSVYEATIPIPFFFLSFSLSDVLYDPTDLIWRKETPSEAITVRTASSSDCLLAEIFWGFSQLQANVRRCVHSSYDHFIITLISSDRRD